MPSIDSIPLSKRASKKNVFHKKINKKVNKQNIQNSKNWLFDDVSEIIIIYRSSWFEVLLTFYRKKFVKVMFISDNDIGNGQK